MLLPRRLVAEKMPGKAELAVLLLFAALASGTRPPPPVSEDTLEKVAGSLEMYVDRLPQMPKIHGYSMEHGRPTPVHLAIGMYQKKWVRFTTLLLSFVPV
jgi:hypothetical protein